MADLKTRAGAALLALAVAAGTAQCAPKEKKRYTVICVDDTVMKRVVVKRCEDQPGSRFRWFWIPDEEHPVPAVGKDVPRSHGSFERPWDASDIKTGRD